MQMRCGPGLEAAEEAALPVLVVLHAGQDRVECVDCVGDVRPLLSITHSARSDIAASVNLGA